MAPPLTLLPPGPAHDAAGLGPGVLAVPEDLDAVDEDVDDPCREAVRILVCGGVLDAIWVKDGEVGEVAGLERAAVVDPEVFRRQRGQAPDRLLL